MSNIVYDGRLYKTDKPKLILVSPSLASCEGIPDLYSDFEVITVTASVQDPMPKNTVVFNPDFLGFNPHSRYVFANKFEDQEPFHRMISEDTHMHRMLENLVADQGETYVKPITMTRDLQLDIPGVKLLGPSPEAAVLHNNKIYQRSLFRGQIPLADGGIYMREELEAAISRHDKGAGVFISRESGGGGVGTVRLQTKSDVDAFLRSETDPEEEYVVDEWLDDIICSPSVQGIISRDGQVFVMDPIEQILKGGLSWQGSVYPLNLPEENLERVKETTREAGKVMYSSDNPFIGWFCVDLLVRGKEHEVLLAEVNARFSGNTPEAAYASETLRASNQPTAMDLEYLCLEGKTDGLQDPAKPDICWKKERIKLPKSCEVTANLPQKTIKELFLKGGTGYFNTHRPGTLIPAGELIATITCVGDTSQEVEYMHQQAIDNIKRNIREV